MLTATGTGALRNSIFALAAVALLVVAAIRERSFLQPPAPTLTPKDWIVLADFSNTMGDSGFDGTLRQGLSVQLEQSPFLSLVSDEEVRRKQLESLPLAQWASRRRQDLLEVLDRFNPTIAELTQAIEDEAEKCFRGSTLDDPSRGLVL